MTRTTENKMRAGFSLALALALGALACHDARALTRLGDAARWQAGLLTGAGFGLLSWACGLARRGAAGRARARALQEAQGRELEAQHEELLAQQSQLVVTARDMAAANARLEYASRRFEELYQALPIPCFCHDADGRIFEWNRAFETCYGLTSVQVFQRRVWEAIGAPDAAGPMRAAIARAFAGEPQCDWELTLGGPGGPGRHLLCSTVPMRGPDGQVTGGISTHLDITDRKRMEEALHKEREFTAAVLDNLQEGIIACDADGTLTVFNRATSELHGLPAAPLPPEQWAAHFDLYHADGATPMRTEEVPLFRAFQGERVCNSEMVIAPRGGRPRTILASGQALTDGQGRKIGAVAAMHDITERKAMEEALRVSEARLRAFHDITAAPEDDLGGKIERLLLLGCREFGMTAGAAAQMDGGQYRVRHAAAPGGAPAPGPARAPADAAPYFGAPVRTAGGDWGALCFSGPLPRAALTPAETDFLRLLAQWVGGEMERRRAQRNVLDSEERFRSAIGSMHEGFMVQDADGTVLLCNAAAGRILGVSAGDLLHRHAVRPQWRIVRADGTAFPRDEQPTRRALATGLPQPDVVLGIARGDGGVTWLSMNAAPLFRDGEAAPYAAVQTFADITERRSQEAQIRDYTIVLEFQKQELEAQRQRLEAQKRVLERTNMSLEVANSALESLATLDGLTGLKNHRAFQERLEDEVSRSQRYGEPLSLIMLDVDHFKQYNDTFGHPAGDEVLRTVGLLLEHNDRETDFAARYGGEEFVVILPNTDGEGARATAERLRESIASQDWPDRPITASLGVSTLTPAMADRAALVAAADGALYHAKEAGRNCAVHAADAAAPSARSTPPAR